MPSLRQRIRARLDRDRHRPILPPRPTRGDLSRLVLPRELYELCQRVELDDQGHGFDCFGMSRDGLALALVITRFMYERWFRVSSHGIEHVPRTGAAVLAVNHSGMLPLDAMMIAADVLRRTGRPARTVMDHFVPDLPFVSSVFSGGGGIGGSRGNFHAVLDRGGLIVVFPEGTRGIGKGFARRYQLQHFSEGHAELAIQHQAPVVPVGVVGAEECWPQVAKLPVHAFGSPYIPVPGTLLPLPTHFHLWYGEPIRTAGRFAPEDCHDADKVALLASEVQDAVAALIERGLAERGGVFS